MDEKAAPVRIEPLPEPPYVYHYIRPRPKVVVKRDLLPGLVVLLTTFAFGLPAGYLWSWLAPAQLKIVSPNDNKFYPIGVESYHRLDALMVFVLIGLGAGAITGIAVWLLRQRRGPVVMLAMTAGSFAAAWFSQYLGGNVAAGAYPMPSTIKPGDTLLVAPSLETWWGILAWPLAAALAYGCCVAWNGLDDLGRRLG
ncbi:hypothetical protein UK23_26240 [Lentzea aerocolonigenes]|uniref:DUF2567 domain-containing protein n=1 Tax=Lentzea aerocolonigenes TaxID=68170 RepID=A0A0F0GS73_LENAE|nr:DUF2567 domain-containing protein [Lentzea aerocolonigenes]KJK45421.1 hypothetical protein UK23_26240 [Lentzea aerocolonigenes]